MPLQQILPTWVALNNANFATASGITDLRTGQDFPSGGLNQGDYFDVTEREANNVSYLANGLLHHGRYRLVHVDSGATPANVKTGTIGFLRAGMFVQGVGITTPTATGASNGTYLVAVPAGLGGGSGAVIQVTITGAPTTPIVSAASVNQGGINYSSVPVIPLAAFQAAIPGITVAPVLALQLNSTPNEITSADQANATTPKTLVNPVVFLNSITPGNYGFVQELGLATVLGTVAAAGNFVSAVLATGLAQDGGTTLTNVTVGQAIDVGTNALFKVYLFGPVTQD